MIALKLALYTAALAAISTEGLALELEVDNQALVGGWVEQDVSNSNSDISASNWVKGGPTEKHPLTSLLDDTESDKSKWLTPNSISEAWVKVDFGKTRRVGRVGFKSANDVSKRDPDEVTIYYCNGACVLAKNQFDEVFTNAIDDEPHVDLKWTSRY